VPRWRNSDTHANGDTYSNSNSDSDGHAHSDSNGYTDRDPDGNSASNANTHGDPECNAAASTDSRAQRDASRHTASTLGLSPQPIAGTREFSRVPAATRLLSKVTQEL
jgi:hypothetical protein